MKKLLLLLVIVWFVNCKPATKEKFPIDYQLVEPVDEKVYDTIPPKKPRDSAYLDTMHQ